MCGRGVHVLTQELRGGGPALSGMPGLRLGEEQNFIECLRGQDASHQKLPQHLENSCCKTCTRNGRCLPPYAYALLAGACWRVVDEVANLAVSNTSFIEPLGMFAANSTVLWCSYNLVLKHVNWRSARAQT